MDLLLHGGSEGWILSGAFQAALCGAQDEAACLRDIDLHLRGKQVILWEELSKTKADITGSLNSV